MGCGGSIQINTTVGGGRIVHGNTALGLFTVEWDAGGKLIREKMQPRQLEASEPTADELRQLKQERADRLI